MRRTLDRPQVVPFEALGKWVAWTPDGLRIAATAETFQAARAEAVRAGVSDPILEWVPPLNELRPILRPEIGANL